LALHYTFLRTFLPPVCKAYLNSSLVIVDEVGYLPVTSQEAYVFFQFVTYRYEKSSTIITSNKSFSDWQELFGDPVIATAILDRLLHHCRVINIKDHSYRLQGHACAKQLTKKEGDSEISESPDLNILSLGVVHFSIHMPISNGAVEGLNNKAKVISHDAYGFRSAKNYILNLYHCMGDLPIPTSMHRFV
jgi:hypothetical protein